MSDRDLDRGLRGILDPGYKTKEEIKKEELDKFYEENVKNYKPSFNPPKSTLEELDPILLRSPVPQWSTPKDKFGHTKAQKDKIILKQLTKPKLTESEIQNKEFWEAYNNGDKMLKYIKKYGDGDEGPVKYDERGYPDKATPEQMQGLKKRLDNARQYTGEGNTKTIHQLTQLKKWSKDPKKYKYEPWANDKVERLNKEEELHPAEQSYLDQYNNIIKKGKSITIPLMTERRVKKAELKNNKYKGGKTYDR